jgi:hypothetical protein
VATFKAMAKAREKKRAAMDQGNAIENETCDVECHEAKSREGESGEAEVTEEEAKLAEDFPDGGESGGKKF